LYDELHIKSNDPALINFITDEFNNTVNIIDTINTDVEYLKTFVIHNSCNINKVLDITNEDIDKYIC
jgi:hypothetical protein